MPALIDIASLGHRLFPIWFFFLLSIGIFQALGRKNIIRDDFCLSCVLSTIVTGCAMVGITQLASAANLLTSGYCRAAWLFADLALGISIAYAVKWNFSQLLSSICEQISRWRLQFSSQSRTTKILLFAVGLFLLVLGLFAIETPATVWDSLTYHLPRIMHWFQERSLHDYATNISRQIDYPPGAEICIAQFMLLAGNDLPANLPEWWALVTTALAAALMSRELLALTPGRNVKVTPAIIGRCTGFAMIIVITTPAAGAEAISSLNDVLAGMWSIGAILLGLLLLQEPENLVYRFACGGAVALGLCTKHSTFLYLTPFVLLISFILIGRRRFRALIQLGLVTFLLSTVINGPWMWRNYRRQGNPLISGESLAANTSPSITPFKIAANVIRNVSFYTRTPSPSITTALNTGLELGSDLLHEPLDSPQQVYEHQSFRFPASSDLSDGSGLGTCYHGLLLLLAGVGFLRQFKIKSVLGVYILTVGTSFILFSALLLWDPWHTRLEFPYFFFAAPFIASVVGCWFEQKFVVFIALFLLLNAALGILGDPQYPIRQSIFHTQSRESLYFYNRPELHPTTAALAGDIIKTGSTNVLLKIGSDTWEYPLWVLLKNRGFKGTIQHALVENDRLHASSVSMNQPRTVLLTMHANAAHIPENFTLSTSYDTWKAYQQAGFSEERARMINNRAVLRYTFAQAGMLTIRFTPCDARGNPVTNGNVNLAVEWTDTKTFQIGAIYRTNISLLATTSFSCPVLAPSATIFITNMTPSNAIESLSKLDVAEKISR